MPQRPSLPTSDGDDKPYHENTEHPTASETDLAHLAHILRLPATEALARVVAGYTTRLPSLLGEADAAREWIDDPGRNVKQCPMSLAFFRRWLQRECASPHLRSLPRASLESAPQRATTRNLTHLQAQYPSSRQALAAMRA